MIKCEVFDCGRRGPDGTPGKDGNSLFLGAPYDSLALLKEARPQGLPGELHVIGGTNVYGWDEAAGAWIFVGPWAGAQAAPDLQELISNMALAQACSVLAVGSVVASASVKELPGQKWLNGQTLEQAAQNYPELLAYVLDAGKYITFEQYAKKLAQDGQCAAYAWDGEDLRLPLVLRPIAGAYGEDIGEITKDVIRKIPPFKLPGSDNSDGGTDWESGPATTVGETDGRNLGFDSAAHGRPIKIDFALLGENYTGSETRGKQILWPYSVVYTAKPAAQSAVPNYIYRAADQSEEANLIKITIGGGFKTLPNNTMLLVCVKNDNTGPVFLKINGGGNIEIKGDGLSLGAGALLAGRTYAFIFNQASNIFDFMLPISAQSGAGELLRRIEALESELAALKANTKIIAGDNITIEEVSAEETTEEN